LATKSSRQPSEFNTGTLEHPNSNNNSQQDSKEPATPGSGSVETKPEEKRKTWRESLKSNMPQLVFKTPPEDNPDANSNNGNSEDRSEVKNSQELSTPKKEEVAKKEDPKAKDKDLENSLDYSNSEGEGSGVWNTQHIIEDVEQPGKSNSIGDSI
jgi:hypothetical protein